MPALGQTHTDEYKRRMSRLRKRLFWKSKSSVIAGWWTGKNRTLSVQHKRNIGLGQLGKKHSLSTRRKMRIAHLGSKAPGWKGGITSTNLRIRESLEYREWRKKVFSRDDYTCQMPQCRVRGGQLEANHIKLFSKFPKIRFWVSNGITLCKPCHRSIRNKEHLYEKQFQELIRLR